MKSIKIIVAENEPVKGLRYNPYHDFVEILAREISLEIAALEKEFNNVCPHATDCLRIQCVIKGGELRGKLSFARSMLVGTESK